MFLHAEIKVCMWSLNISVENLEIWSNFITFNLTLTLKLAFLYYTVVIFLWTPGTYNENLFCLICLVKNLQLSQCVSNHMYESVTSQVMDGHAQSHGMEYACQTENGF